MNQDELKSWLSYDESTGIFRWLKRPSNRVRVGETAGCLDRAGGYVLIRVSGKLYKASRLAWLYMTGKWPPEHIDHMNLNRSDNRFANLREASNSLNMQNRRNAQKNNKTGFLGVSPSPHGFIAQIAYGGKHVNLGTFATPEAAHATYLIAKRKHHEGSLL